MTKRERMLNVIHLYMMGLGPYASDGAEKCLCELEQIEREHSLLQTVEIPPIHKDPSIDALLAQEHRALVDLDGVCETIGDDS
jgi:hypothetical protein